jgi:hypothetical protein
VDRPRQARETTRAAARNTTHGTDVTYRSGHQAAADTFAQIMLARTGQHGSGTFDPLPSQTAARASRFPTPLGPTVHAVDTCRVRRHDEAMTEREALQFIATHRIRAQDTGHMQVALVMPDPQAGDAVFDVDDEMWDGLQEKSVQVGLGYLTLTAYGRERLALLTKAGTP